MKTQQGSNKPDDAIDALDLALLEELAANLTAFGLGELELGQAGMQPAGATDDGL